MAERNIEDTYPLAPMQQGMLFHALYTPRSGVYHQQVICTLHGPLQVSAFTQAWQCVVERHSVLRTAFRWDLRDEPFQVVYRHVELPWEQHDWRNVAAVDQEVQLEAFLQADQEQGFECSKAPLLRLALIQVAADTYHVVWSHHHLLLDRWSTSILLKELFTLYSACCQGQNLHLERSRPYGDYIAWLHRQDLVQAEAFWRRTLKGYTAPISLSVKQEVGRVSQEEVNYDEQQIRLSVASTSAMQALARQHRLSLNTLVQGAWALLLSRYSGEEDVVFGAVVSGRPPALEGVESMVGLFINTLPMRARVDPEAALLPWLQALQAFQTEAYQYEYSPLVQVQRWSEVSHEVALFESIVIFANYPMQTLLPEPSGSLKLRDIRIAERTHYPLTLMVEPGSQLALQISYQCPSFERTTIARMLGHLKTLLEGMVADPIRRLADLPLLTEAEREQLLVEWNATAAPYPHEVCLPQLFEAQVERSPAAVAVVYEGQPLSYGELNAQANQLAHHLRSLGVGPDALVGICVERSLEMVVGLLGILKAGGAYVPLDPAYPQERLAFMLADSQAAVLLTQERLVVGLPEHRAQVLCLDADWPDIARTSEENPAGGVKPTDLAYVIYTSGSTGKPKGVQIPHRAAVNFLHAMRQRPGLTAQDVMLAVTTLSFDIALLELFLPMSVGAQVVVVSREVASDSGQLQEKLATSGATVMQATPATWRLLLETGWRGNKQLKILCGGEALPRDLADRLRSRCGRLWNMYGPTETTVWSTVHQVEAGEGAVSIGRPIANTQVYVLDAELQSVPIGVAGELHIGGEGLARGYLNRPELTAEKFIAHPFSKEPKARLYKTGDLARYLPNGAIECLGRLDHQVKIRGFRIELGEIEAVLGQHLAVKENVVLAQEDVPGAKRLVAYLIASQEPAPSIGELRRFLKEKLPDYMVPSAFVFLEALPLTPNGKVDRKALPAPDQSRPEPEAAYVAPRTELERFLANTWSVILHVDRIGIHDNFFALGGDSIQAAVFINKVQQELKQFFYVVALFDLPTIGEFAAYLNSRYKDVVARFNRIDTAGSQKVKVEFDDASRIDEAKIAQIRALIRSVPPHEERHEAATVKNPPAVFILSAPRSGSTLLRAMLAGNPHLFAPPELELLGFHTLEERKTVLSGRFSLWLEGTLRAIMEIKGGDAEQAKQVMSAYEDRKLTTQQFYREMQEWIGDKKLVDKSTTYALDVETLKRAESYFDNPLYIYLSRHPHGMIKSFQDVSLDQVFFRYEHPFSARELAELIWIVAHQNIQEFLEQVPENRQYHLRFEDLVNQPQEILEEMCQFMRLEFHPDMVHPYKDKGRKMTDGIHSVSTMLGDMKFHQHANIDPSLAESWKESHTEDFLGNITWQIAETLGYERPEDTQEGREPSQTTAVSARWPAAGPVVVPLQPKGSKPPFFFLSGRHHVGDRLGPDQPVYRLVYQDLDREQPLVRVEDMAAHSIKGMRTIQPDGPYYLGGHGLGGTVAFEMAHQLQRQGQQVALLALCESRAPGSRRSTPGTSSTQRLWQRANYYFHRARRIGSSQELAALLSRLKKKTQRIAWRRQAVPRTLSRQGYRAAGYEALRRYVPQVYSGRITVVRGTERAPWRNDDPLKGWGRLATDGVKAYEIPGNHTGIYKEPNVGMLARTLNDVLRKAQTRAESGDGDSLP